MTTQNRRHFCSCEKKAWTNSGLYGIRTLDLCDTGAALYQLTSQLGAGRCCSVWRFCDKLYFRIGLSTLNVVRFRNYLLCSRIFHTESGDPARTRLTWNYLASRNTVMKWEIKPNNCEHSGSYGKKKKLQEGIEKSNLLPSKKLRKN